MLENLFHGNEHDTTLYALQTNRKPNTSKGEYHKVNQFSCDISGKQICMLVKEVHVGLSQVAFARNVTNPRLFSAWVCLNKI